MTKASFYYAYTRVSTRKQGDQGVSLQEQREAIERYAKHNGLVISEWFEEKETAAKHGRPIFSSMLKGLKKGKAKGVIIHKIDRSARNLRDWIDLLDLGVDVHFAKESLDLSSRGGRLSADIQAVVAADFIRNLREETRKGFYGRLKQGLYPLPAPLGYINKGKGLPKEIDPIYGPIVRRLFSLYATGKYNFAKLQLKANILGLRTRSGGHITLNGISTMLNNPFYMGIIRLKSTGETFQGIHKPLISASTFNKVKDVLRGRTPTRLQEHDFLYRKMFTCALCAYTLTGEKQKGHVYYRCHQKDCATKGIREESLDQQIESSLANVQFNDEEKEHAFAALNEKKSEAHRHHEELLSSFDLRLGKIEKKREKLENDYLEEYIDPETFYRMQEKLLSEKASLKEKRDRIMQDSGYVISELMNYFELSENALLTYKSAKVDKKRRMLKITTSNRAVERKNVVVELAQPFAVIANRHVLSNCDPYRDRLRTWRVICAELVKFIKRK